MSNYINTETGEYPVSFSRVKKVMRGTSFSIEPESAGVFKRVNDGPIPSFNRDTQFVTEGKPTKVDGGYIRNWVVEDYTQEQVEQKKANEYSRAATSVRAKRDTLIAATDYLALSDTTLTAEMAAYRQALRDITAHANFPYLLEEDWPVKP